MFFLIFKFLCKLNLSCLFYNNNNELKTITNTIPVNWVFVNDHKFKHEYDGGESGVAT